MATALYRKNGGEGIKYSLINQSFAEADPTYYGVLTNPTIPNGTQIREPLVIVPGQPRYGPRRQLGWAKIAIPATNTWRNATQLEIDFFDDAEGIDEQAIDAAQAREQVIKHPFVARVLWSLLRMIVASTNQQNTRINLMAVKTNLLLTQWASMKTIMNSGVSVATMRTQIGALPAIAADIPETLPASRTAAAVGQDIRNDILNADAPRRGA
jgi:hypothetical protein